MLAINPIEAVLWTFRRNEKDVVNLYNSLSSIMRLATGSRMLNFGYWKGDVQSPTEAQSKLCTLVGRLADLTSASTLIDVGSGYGFPALQWSREFMLSNIVCVNINSRQLLERPGLGLSNFENTQMLTVSWKQTPLTHINSTSLSLPFADSTVDRIIALESAQHFKPFERFIEEAFRILQSKGLLIVAMPVSVFSGNALKKLVKLGILNLTWSSEHYGPEYVKSIIQEQRFKIMVAGLIGAQVYEPLATYYIQNRKALREKITAHYPPYVERILCKSLVKMMNVSKKGLIEYIVLKAQKL